MNTQDARKQANKFQQSEQVQKLLTQNEIWHKTLWSLFSVIVHNIVCRDRRRLSNQCTQKQRILASKTPRGRNQRLLLFPCWSPPGWHVLFFSCSHSKSNRPICAISKRRHECDHLCRTVWTRLMGARLPVHSGQCLIAVQGFIVDNSSVILFQRQKITKKSPQLCENMFALLMTRFVGSVQLYNQPFFVDVISVGL